MLGGEDLGSRLLQEASDLLIYSSGDSIKQAPSMQGKDWQLVFALL